MRLVFKVHGLGVYYDLRLSELERVIFFMYLESRPKSESKVTVLSVVGFKFRLYI